MPARVHALLVVRPDGHASADIHLRRTLNALRAQTRPVDALTIVLCGSDEAVQALAAESGAEGVVAAPRGTRFAEALDIGAHRVDGDAVWLLAQDTAPEPDALARLAGALETAPSVAFAAPKLVRWDDRGRLVSLGVAMSRGGLAVGLADGELDQGQHDGREDVLGADVRGLLVRADTWRQLGGLDRALSGADEGLDFGVRARLAGGRVALAPGAVIAVAGDGVGGIPDDRSARSRARAAYARRAAQLHRRLVYAPAAISVLHWLALLPIAVWRSLGHLLAKRPASIGPELGAAVVAMVRIPSIVRARGRIRRTRRASWAQLAPLRISGRQLRDRLDTAPTHGEARSDLHFFSGGGAWIVLAALAVSVAAFPALLAWPALGGGALAPLRATVMQLWADATQGARPLGWDTVGPADPFSAIVAMLGSLWPWAPSRAVVGLWVLALPLAALGGWFAMTRLTERSLPRAVGAIGWALAPTFLTALADGRPTGVIAHLLLPWLLFTASAARRSWTSAGVGSLLLAAVLACSPSLAPAAVLLWLIAVILTIALRRGEGVGRVIWLVVPASLVFTPLVWHRVHQGTPWLLLADPGVAAASTAPGTDLLGRLTLLAGFPTTEVGGWAGFAAFGVIWVPLLIVPIVIAALCAPLLGRLVPAALLLLTAATGLTTAFVLAGVSLAADGATTVPMWTGCALSLAWAGLLGAAVVTVDRLPVARGARALASLLIIAALAAAAVPALTAVTRGESLLTNGPESTLPAYVDAEGKGGTRSATLVLTAAADGGFAAEVVWGGSETLGGQTTLQSARSALTAADQETAEVTADLVTGTAGDVVDRLRAHGVAFVLLSESAKESDAARNARLAAASALDLRNDLENVGDTGKGVLWRVTGEVTSREPGNAESEDAWVAALLQLAAIAIALLLAVPTISSIREARRYPRVIGSERR